jgi:hypothetical protein
MNEKDGEIQKAKIEKQRKREAASERRKERKID